MWNSWPITILCRKNYKDGQVNKSALASAKKAHSMEIIHE